jgi:hypothetical protein
MVDLPDDDQDALVEDEASETEEVDDSAPEQRSIREVLAAKLEDEREEARRAEIARARQEQDVRVAAARTRRTEEERAERRTRLRVASETRARVQTDLTAASRSLAKAMRVAAGAALPRLSSEGLEQRKLLRALDEAMQAVRRAGRFASRPLAEDSETFEPQAEPEIELQVEAV